MSDLRSMCEAALRKQAQKHAQIKHAEDIIAAFDKQWLENDYLVLDDLLWVIAEASPDNREAYILPIIQSAITSKALTVWDENKSFKLNDKFIHAQSLRKELLLKKALVLKQDFLVWQQQANNLSIPQWLVDLGRHDIVVEPDIQAVATENEALKARVAELEQLLSAQKELPTITKNKVMPIIYGLCCLYENKGKPLPKSRASCNAIADELQRKYGIVIGDKGLENYYKAGMVILGKN